MSEASRQRWLFIHNRLEELCAKYGPPPEIPLDGAECDPSWGPLGSLARQLLLPAEYARLVALDQEISPGIHKPPTEPVAPKAADW